MMPNGQDISGIESGPNNHNNFQGDPNFNRMWQPGLFPFLCISFFHVSSFYSCQTFFGVNMPCPSGFKMQSCPLTY